MTTVRAFNKKLFAALPLAAALIAGGAALNSTQAAEPDLNNNLYAAIYAEQECGTGKFSQAQWERLVKEVNKHWSADVEVGKVLSYVDDTKIKVAEISRERGCSAAELELLRAKFASELQPHM